jgi:hypothetical protein
LLSAKNESLVNNFDKGGAPRLTGGSRWVAYGPACPMFYEIVDQRSVDLKVED